MIRMRRFRRSDSRLLADQITEAELQASVRELASIEGWAHYHTADSRKSEPGFPDSILCRGRRLIAAELKRETGKLTAEQSAWLERLKRTGAEVHVWRPSDWRSGRIAAVLAA